MNSKWKFLVFGIAAGLALVLAGWRFLEWPYTFKGSVIDPPIPAADFALTDQHGGAYRLSEQRGKLVMIFFGYTSCPDVCPVTLAKFRWMKRQLGANADKISFVFITVDPERDTPQKLGEHVANFDPDFAALTGSPEELAQVWKDYGVYQAKVETDSALGYLVDHSTRTYVIDQEGNWLLTFPYEMEPETMLQDIRHLLRK